MKRDNNIFTKKAKAFFIYCKNSTFICCFYGKILVAKTK